jgi:protein ImuB
MYACLHGKGNLTALACEFSPTVEQTSADTVTLDASGLDRLFGMPQDIASAIARRAAEINASADPAPAIALAMNPDAAICAARGFPGISIIPQGDEAKFLATLPVSQLDPTPDLLETLDRWGIRRFHELAALPPLGIAERLGAEGLHLRALARGEAERKLLAIEDPLHFEDEIELDYPVELLEPLAFLLARLVNGLATRLATRGLADR